LANKTGSTFAKRQKELARQAKRKLKEAKRLEKKAEGDPELEPDASTEDPDLIGITLGPQPDNDDADDEGDEEKPDAHERP
jgi:hypothetical protein